MDIACAFDPAVSANDAFKSQSSPLQSGSPPALGSLIMSAALSLPGILTAAHAETIPERASISLRYLDYEDRQPGLQRITSHSPSVSVTLPVAGAWSIEGTLVSDHISGASPRYHTAISSASNMKDIRNAGDVQVTHYFPGGQLTIGAAYSTENDYTSRALSLVGSMSSANKNTTWTFGVGGARDTINPVNLIVINEKKATWEMLAGITQVLTPRDIAQINVTFSHGRGYFSDPYKLLDNRPRERDQKVFRLGWNHHFDKTDGTSRLSYRYYSDTYKIRAHTFNAEYVQPLPQDWKITPSVRFHTQSSASFYFDPVYDPDLGMPFPPGYVFGSNQYVSTDQRLSGFGARTIGIRIEKKLSADLSVDLKLESYEQRGSWRAFGTGSRGLDTFHARSIQVGLTQEF